MGLILVVHNKILCRFKKCIGKIAKILFYGVLLTVIMVHSLVKRVKFFIGEIDIARIIIIIRDHSNTPCGISDESVIILFTRIKKVPSQRRILIGQVNQSCYGWQYIYL